MDNDSHSGRLSRRNLLRISALAATTALLGGHEQKPEVSTAASATPPVDPIAAYTHAYDSFERKLNAALDEVGAKAKEHLDGFAGLRIEFCPSGKCGKGYCRLQAPISGCSELPKVVEAFDAYAEAARLRHEIDSKPALKIRFYDETLPEIPTENNFLEYLLERSKLPPVMRRSDYEPLAHDVFNAICHCGDVKWQRPHEFRIGLGPEMIRRKLARQPSVEFCHHFPIDTLLGTLKIPVKVTVVNPSRREEHALTVQR